MPFLPCADCGHRAAFILRLPAISTQAADPAPLRARIPTAFGVQPVLADVRIGLARGGLHHLRRQRAHAHTAAVAVLLSIQPNIQQPVIGYGKCGAEFATAAALRWVAGHAHSGHGAAAQAVVVHHMVNILLL